MPYCTIQEAWGKMPIIKNKKNINNKEKMPDIIVPENSYDVQKMYNHVEYPSVDYSKKPLSIYPQDNNQHISFNRVPNVSRSMHEPLKNHNRNPNLLNSNESQYYVINNKPKSLDDLMPRYERKSDNLNQVKAMDVDRYPEYDTEDNYRMFNEINTSTTLNNIEINDENMNMEDTNNYNINNSTLRPSNTTLGPINTIRSNNTTLGPSNTIRSNNTTLGPINNQRVENINEKDYIYENEQLENFEDEYDSRDTISLTREPTRRNRRTDRENRVRPTRMNRNNVSSNLNNYIKYLEDQNNKLKLLVKKMDKNKNLSKKSNIFDLLLYIISGIFIIFILDSFIRLISKKT